MNHAFDRLSLNYSEAVFPEFSTQILSEHRLCSVNLRKSKISHKSNPSSYHQHKKPLVSVTITVPHKKENLKH